MLALFLGYTKTILKAKLLFILIPVFALYFLPLSHHHTFWKAASMRSRHVNRNWKDLYKGVRTKYFELPFGRKEKEVAFYNHS